MDDPGCQILVLNRRDTDNPEGGGSEVYVERVAAELVARGYQVTLVCAGYPGAVRDEVVSSGVRVVRRGGRHTVFARAALLHVAGRIGLGPLARGTRHRPALIIDVGNGLPFLAPWYARCPVIALVHHVHREQWPVVLSAPLARFGWWVESWLAPRVYRRCRYVTVSGATRDELVGLGVRREQITVIHNGTPPLVGRAVPRSEEPLLVVLGRLVPHKRVEIALRAVAALTPDFSDLRLVVAGRGWWDEELRRLTEQLGLTDRVRFAGFVTEAEKSALLAAAWIVLAPSLKEGWGLTIVEAGMAGTPAVACRGAGGVAEAVLDGQTGLLAVDDEHFQQSVRQLLVDAAARCRMGSAARAHAASFTWAAAGASFAGLVAQVLETSRPAKRRVQWMAPRSP